MKDDAESDDYQNEAYDVTPKTDQNQPGLSDNIFEKSARRTKIVNDPASIVQEIHSQSHNIANYSIPVSHEVDGPEGEEEQLLKLDAVE